MKNKQHLTAEEREYRKRMWHRRFCLYLVLAVAFIVVLVQATGIFVKSDRRKLEPQVSRAVKQLSSLLPQLEQNEQALMESYGHILKSLEYVHMMSSLPNSTTNISVNLNPGLFIEDSLSWMDRVTGLKVGREGYMFVVSKETNQIIAHPKNEYVGQSYLPIEDMKDIIDLSSVDPETMPEDLDLELSVITPNSSSGNIFSRVADVVSNMGLTMVGVAIDYRDTYIVCGIPMMEALLNVFRNALIFSMTFLVIMWLFIKWINLVTVTRRETVKTFRPKLIACSVIVCLFLFGVSWYTQIMTDVTNDLKAMDKHADMAVETLDAYKFRRQMLNDLVDEFYTAQSSIAGMYVASEGKDNLTRDDMRRFAEELYVTYIYVFDQQGNVIVTNSPYDHLRLSDDPEDPTYRFHALLDGVNKVISEPFYDEVLQKEIQYIGVSMRSADDLCDGFVMIAVDTVLRNSLLKSLSVITVLSNLVIGLPDYAIAVNKSNMKISATTGLGYIGQSIENLGISEADLAGNMNGYQMINGKVYYVGVGETEDMYIIPMVHRSGNLSSFVVAVALTLSTVLTLVLIILLSLFRYQRDVIDGVPASLAEEQAQESEHEMVADEIPHGFFAGFVNFLHAQKKKGIEDRWHINNTPKEKRTPEQHLSTYIYWLMLIFCLFVLLPTLYVSLNSSSQLKDLSNLAYMMSGTWQKGLNIFALTACIFILCAMYVCVVIISRVLYLIAKMTSLRVETVCLLLRNSLKYICVIIFIYYGLAQFGVDTKTLLASAGILSLMISFGAKDLVSDIIAGFFIIIEGSYKVGDFISVNGWIGTVVEIGLRTTRVRFYSDTKIFNNSTMRDLINSDGEVARMVLSMPIGYDADLEAVEKILEEELPKLKDVIPGLVKPPMYEGVDSFEASCVLLRITIFMETPYRYSAFRALKREVKLIFDRRGIKVPFNQIVVHEAHD